MLSEDPRIQRADHALVVVRRRARLELGQPLFGLRFAGLLFEDGGVKAVFVGKMLKDDRLGHPGGGCYLPRGGAAKPALREDAKPGIDELLTALRHRQTRGADGVTTGSRTASAPVAGTVELAGRLRGRLLHDFNDVGCEVSVY